MKKLNAANVRLKKSIVKRNEIIKIMNDEKNELSFQLQLELTEAENNTTVIQRERDHRNRKPWPLLVLNIIIEILDNGTLPSAVSKNLKHVCRLMCPDVKIIELPSIDFIRKMRGVIRTLTEAHAMCLLGKNPKWRKNYGGMA